MSKKPLERRERLPERKKARIVLDTNVLISAWLWDGDEARVVELVERGVLEAYTSPKLLEELDRALRYSKLGLTDEEADSAIGYYVSILKVVQPAVKLSVVTEDPDDDRVLECALHARADYVISGDDHLLRIGDFRGMRIVRAPELLKQRRS